MDKQFTYYDFIKKVKERPGTYLGNDMSVKNMRTISSEFIICQYENNLPLDFTMENERYFHEFVKDKLLNDEKFANNPILDYGFGYDTYLDSLGLSMKESLQLLFDYFEEY